MPTGACPTIGYLAADLERRSARLGDAPPVPTSTSTRETEVNGVRLLNGPVGGVCAITSRELNERVGGFRQRAKEIFWLEDAAYIEDIERLGFGAAVLADLKVHHTGGDVLRGGFNPRRTRSGRRETKRRARRTAIKKLAFRVPVLPAPERALRLVRRRPRERGLGDRSEPRLWRRRRRPRRWAATRSSRPPVTKLRISPRSRRRSSARRCGRRLDDRRRRLERRARLTMAAELAERHPMDRAGAHRAAARKGCARAAGKAGTCSSFDRGSAGAVRCRRRAGDEARRRRDAAA